MSKGKGRDELPVQVAVDITRNDPNDGGCGLCLLMTSLMLAAPVAGVVLIVRRWPR